MHLTKAVLCRDHTYGNKKVLTASYEPKDEVCEDYIKLEPAVTAEEARYPLLRLILERLNT